MTELWREVLTGRGCVIGGGSSCSGLGLLPLLGGVPNGEVLSVGR